ncbi:SAM-dependent methyltransferase, partial [Stutzerimonas stutzeri]
WRASAERRAAVIDTPLTVRVAIRYDWIERIS